MKANKIDTANTTLNATSIKKPKQQIQKSFQSFLHDALIRRGVNIKELKNLKQFNYSPIAQLVEQTAVNRWVVGSSPTWRVIILDC